MSTFHPPTPSPTAPAAQTLDIGIGGMTCAACVGRLERVLSKLPGVFSVSVNLATESARIQWQPSAAPAPAAAQAQAIPFPARVARAVRDAGYEPRPLATAHDAEAAARLLGVPREAWPPLLALLLAAPLLLPMLAEPFGVHAMLPPAWQFALATAVQFGLGWRFYRLAWQGLRHRSGNMEQLVALGTTAGWALSTWLWWQAPPGHTPHLYYEGSAVVIALVLLGKWLEARAKHQTTEALRALHRLRPERAHLLPDGVRRSQAVDIPVSELLPGDCVLVRPGQRIPADGQVIDGLSHADESMLSGESLPVPKEPGSPVTGGTLNGDSALTVRVTAVGAQSTLERIVALVQDAQSHKAPVQRLVDRVASVFVPLVLLLALATLVGWRIVGAPWEEAIVHAVAVLVIACPCALGLATPAALMVGTGAAARAGILIRDPQALELARRVRTVVLDKTGTLTLGQPRLVRLLPEPGTSAEQALHRAAALARDSTHPLAHAVRCAAKASAAPIPPGAEPAFGPVRHIPGCGSQAELDGQPLRLGSLRWLVREGALSAEQAQAHEHALQAEAATAGATVSALAWGPRLMALLVFADPPKPTAAAAIARLRARGLRVLMLTGDRRAAATATARALGLAPSELIADVLPADKAHAIQRLQSQTGQPVAMVGDGVNDAPALATADVGIAIAHGRPSSGAALPGATATSDIALHAAGITLLTGEPLRIADALDISQRTVRKIRQNLFWAFAYNAAGLPLAALGALSPVIAGAAMALSSVSVIANALLLSRWRPAPLPSHTPSDAPADTPAHPGP